MINGKLKSISFYFLIPLTFLIFIQLIGSIYKETRNCTYVGSELNEYFSVNEICQNSALTVTQWANNLRIINKYVVYNGSYSKTIFTDAMEKFSLTGKISEYHKFKSEVRLYSKILDMAAQTAAQAPEFKEGIFIKAKLWEIQFKIAHYIVDGPLIWTLPSDPKQLSPWKNFYYGTINIPRDTFNQMCETLEIAPGSCYDPKYN